MSEEYDLGWDAATGHMKREHSDYATSPIHCGLGGFECPFCGWMVTVDVTPGEVEP